MCTSHFSSAKRRHCTIVEGTRRVWEFVSLRYTLEGGKNSHVILFASTCSARGSRIIREETDNRPHSVRLLDFHRALRYTHPRVSPGKFICLFPFRMAGYWQSFPWAPQHRHTLEAVRARAKERIVLWSERAGRTGRNETERRVEQVRIYTCWWILKRTSYPRHFYWPSLCLFLLPPFVILVTSRHRVSPSFSHLSLLSRSSMLSCNLNASKKERCCAAHNCKVKSSTFRLAFV